MDARSRTECFSTCSEGTKDANQGHGVRAPPAEVQTHFPNCVSRRGTPKVPRGSCRPGQGPPLPLRAPRSTEGSVRLGGQAAVLQGVEMVGRLAVAPPPVPDGTAKADCPGRSWRLSRGSSGGRAAGGGAPGRAEGHTLSCVSTEHSWDATGTESLTNVQTCQKEPCRENFCSIIKSYISITKEIDTTQKTFEKKVIINHYLIS